MNGFARGRQGVTAVTLSLSVVSAGECLTPVATGWRFPPEATVRDVTLTDTYFYSSKYTLDSIRTA